MRIAEKSKNVIRKAFLIIDTLLFSVLLTLMILPYLDMIRHTWIVIPVFLCIILFTLIIRTRSRIAQQNRISYQKAVQQKIEQLLLMSDRELSDRFGKHNFILIRKEHPGRFDVMEALRQHADAIGLFSKDKTLTELIKAHSPDTAIYSLHDMIDLYEMKGRDGDSIPARIISFAKQNKYLLLGILFLVASFFLKSKIYYRITASLCLIIAPVSGILRNMKQSKNFLIFLDKMDD